MANHHSPLARLGSRHLQLVRAEDVVRGAPARWGFHYRVTEVLMRPALFLTTRHRWRGAGHIPESGPVIIAANHLSYAEPATMAHFVIMAAGRLPRFMIKQGVMETLFPGRLLSRMKMIPVLRASADASRALDSAATSLAEGECVVIYPEGTITRDPDLWPMKGRTGVARLALTTGAPVIPVASWGAHKVFGYDRRHQFLRRHRVDTIAGAPVDLSRWIERPVDAQVLAEVTAEIMRAVTDLLADLRGESVPHEVFDPRYQDSAGA